MATNTRRVSVENPDTPKEKVTKEVEEDLDLQLDEETAEDSAFDDILEEDEEEHDEDSELWEGGPTYRDLDGWKAQFGEDNIFVSLTDPEYCIWRTLNRHEYRQLMKELEMAISSGQVSEAEATFNNEEAMTEICVLYPKYNRHDKVGTRAGFPRVMANEIMEQSGFIPVEVRKL